MEEGCEGEKMTNIIIIHGAFGNPNENWFPWLKNELEKLNNSVFVPEFPTPKGQTLENWLKVFKKYESHLNEQSLVIGHSLGTAFLLNVLESINKPIKAAFFIAGFIGPLNNPTFDDINKTFTEKSFNWDRILENCKKFYVFHSDNDPYVPLKKAEELAKHLNTKVIIVKDSGHFNDKKFDILLERIKIEI